MQILDELRDVARKLDAEGIDYALCGGLAMGIYAMPRATLDIDLMVEAEALPRALAAVAELGFTVQAEPMTFKQGQVRISRVSKIDETAGEHLVLDFLVVTPGTTAAWDGRRKVRWGEHVLSVLSPQGLIELKSLRGNGQDRDDIDYLRSIVDGTED